MQIAGSPDLQPTTGMRQSPISGVVLASADLDHVLGLLLLRELQPLRVFATNSVLTVLREDNSFFAMLNRVPGQVAWNAVRPGDAFELSDHAAKGSGMVCTAMSIGTRYPAYVAPARAQELVSEEAVAGLIVETPGKDGNPGKRLAYLSAVGAIDKTLLNALAEVDILLFDGTFWSDDELIRVDSSAATARQMGHIPVGGPDGSLRQLAGLRKPRKMFIHINNTNPMLNEDGPQYRAVREAGWEIAEDGSEL